MLDIQVVSVHYGSVTVKKNKHKTVNLALRGDRFECHLYADRERDKIKRTLEVKRAVFWQ